MEPGRWSGVANRVVAQSLSISLKILKKPRASFTPSKNRVILFRPFGRLNCSPPDVGATLGHFKRVIRRRIAKHNRAVLSGFDRRDPASCVDFGGQSRMAAPLPNRHGRGGRPYVGVMSATIFFDIVNRMPSVKLFEKTWMTFECLLIPKSPTLAFTTAQRGDWACDSERALPRPIGPRHSKNGLCATLRAWLTSDVGRTKGRSMSKRLKSICATWHKLAFDPKDFRCAASRAALSVVAVKKKMSEVLPRFCGPLRPSFSAPRARPNQPLQRNAHSRATALS